jgi:hypothetical protein
MRLAAWRAPKILIPHTFMVGGVWSLVVGLTMPPQFCCQRARISSRLDMNVAGLRRRQTWQAQNLRIPNKTIDVKNECQDCWRRTLSLRDKGAAPIARWCERPTSAKTGQKWGTLNTLCRLVRQSGCLCGAGRGRGSSDSLDQIFLFALAFCTDGECVQ